MLSVLCQRRAKKQLVQQEVDYLNYLDGRVGGLTEEEAKIIAQDEPVTFENEKHLYSGELQNNQDTLVEKFPQKYLKK